METSTYIPIKMESTFKASDLTKVSLVRYKDGNKLKVDAPQFSGEHQEHNKEALLYVVREFQAVVMEELELQPTGPNDHNTIKDQFVFFRRMLTEQARAYFNQISPVYLDDYDFDGCLAMFLKTSGYIAEEDRGQQLAYLQKVKKPFKYSVAHFYSRLLVLFAYAALMPGEIDDDGNPAVDPRVTPTDMTLKDIIYQAMPLVLKQDFIRSNQKLSNISISALISYMDSIKASHDIHPNPHGRHKQKNQPIDEEDEEKANSGKHKHKKHKGKQGSSKSKQGAGKHHRVQPDDDCPLHPDATHKWKDCYIKLRADKQALLDKSQPREGTGSKGKKASHHNQLKSGDEEQKEDVAESHDATLDWQTSSSGDDDDDGKSADCTSAECTSKLCNEIADILSSSNSAVFPDTSTAWQNEVGINNYRQNMLYTNTSSLTTSYPLEIYMMMTAQAGKSVVGDASPDLLPASVAVFGHIQQVKSTHLYHVLFDSGGSHTMFNKRALPPNVVPTYTTGTSITVSGSLKSSSMVMLKDILLPEFSRSRKVDLTLSATIFDNKNVQFDCIFGRDFLNTVGIDIHHSTQTIHWLDLSTSFKPSGYWKHPKRALQYMLLPDPWSHSSFVTVAIQDATYVAVDVHDVVKAQHHLSSPQQDQLIALLLQHTELFSGTLGCFPQREYDLDLIPTAIPKHFRAYPIPKVHEETFKKEVNRLLSLGVLEHCGASEWASPTFIIPKKDGQVRMVSDFRYLNSMIKRRIYPLPRIIDILRRRNGYKYFTKIDVTMQYYAFKLTEAAKNLCVIVTPFGKYRYARLPMGVKQSPDIAQEAMESIFMDLPNVETYIDDIGIFDNSWDAHLQSLNAVLTHLHVNGFTVNPKKCEWAVQETDWLGYWLTPHGLKPWSKKVAAILAMDRPTNQKQVRSFIGAVTYYRDMWPRRSHLLAPLTQLTGPKSKTFIWGTEQEEAFQAMKAMIASETMLYYPDHNLPFHVYTDASDYQLGAVIIQEDHPVAYYSRKLSTAQCNYTVIEKELLSIVEVLKEFCTMLLGCCALHIYTDHRNLTYNTFTAQRVLRWHVFLEEFNPIFHYIKGATNILADALSRVPCIHLEGQEGPVSSTTPDLTATESFYSLMMDDMKLTECFLNHPPLNELPFPLHFGDIHLQQQHDAQLHEHMQRHPDHFQQIVFGDDISLICYCRQPNETPRICIPTNLLNNIIQWYHVTLSHAGITRLYDSITTHFYHPKLKQGITEFVSHCNACQRFKLPGAAYGELPPRDVLLQPFTEVAVDLIGPWAITLNGQDITFLALTCIDPVTCLVELVRVDNKTAAHVGMKFENTWLARYPHPLRCVHDNGSEFIGFDFQIILETNGIQDVPTTARNPQSNAICERMHQTVGNLLRALCHTNPPQNVVDANELVDSALATAMHAMRSTVHRSLEVAPGALVFHRDMFLDIPLHADLLAIQARRQNIVNENLRRSNLRRRTFDYQVGQQVMIVHHNPATLGPRVQGPFPIHQVHVNGTVSIRHGPHVVERINICRLKPYHP